MLFLHTVYTRTSHTTASVQVHCVHYAQYITWHQHKVNSHRSGASFRFVWMLYLLFVYVMINMSYFSLFHWVCLSDLSGLLCDMATIYPSIDPFHVQSFTEPNKCIVQRAHLRCASLNLRAVHEFSNEPFPCEKKPQCPRSQAADAAPESFTLANTHPRGLRWARLRSQWPCLQ